MPNARATVSRSAASALTAQALIPTPSAINAPSGVPSLTRVGFAPIVRVDVKRREVELCATSEAVDTYGTIFDYAASKEAFSRWIGNVREMHERRAVGTRVGVRFDDDARRVYVRVRISRGAEDTWEKIQDGTLRGASIGASNVTWQRQTRPLVEGERAVQVDNPANPDALGVSIVRDAVPDAALLDAFDALDTAEAIATEKAEGSGNRVESLPSDPPASPQPRLPASFPGRPVKEAGRSPLASFALDAAQSWTETRAELRSVASGSASDAYNTPSAPSASAPTDQPMGSATGEPLHAALLSIAQACGCALCQMATALYAAPDVDASATTRRASSSPSETSVNSVSSMVNSSPAIARAIAVGLGANGARLDAVDMTIRSMRGVVQVAVSQMSSTLGDLRLRLDALEAQPLPGGPTARPVEKTFALSAERYRGGVAPAEQIRALESLAGKLADPQAQIAVAAELIRLQQG